MTIDLNKQPHETNGQYKWRLYKAKSEGLIEIGWERLSAIIDDNIRPGENRMDESVYRKEAAILAKFYAEQMAENGDDKQKAALEEIKKERIKLRDERTDLNRQLRAIARSEREMEYLGDLFKEQGRSWYKPVVKPDMMVPHGDRETLVLLSDFHIGACFDNHFGKYDSNVAKTMLDKYAEAVLHHSMLYGSNVVNVMLLGDMLSGSIHKSISVTNRENVIEQVKVAATLIGDFLYELSTHFDYVNVTSVTGNHTRLEKKEDALKDERLDDLLPYILECRLSHVEGITFAKGVDTTLTSMEILGRVYVGVHGDMDDMSRDTVAKLATMLGYVPYCVCMGHMHHAEYRDICGVKFVMGGTLQGSGDDYTVSKRLTGKPSQTFMICDNDGILAHIPVEF